MFLWLRIFFVSWFFRIGAYFLEAGNKRAQKINKRLNSVNILDEALKEDKKSVEAKEVIEEPKNLVDLAPILKHPDSYQQNNVGSIKQLIINIPSVNYYVLMAYIEENRRDFTAKMGHQVPEGYENSILIQLVVAGVQYFIERTDRNETVNKFYRELIKKK